MPLPADLVGRTTAPVIHDVDARWLMAYAASVGATDDRYLDTRRENGIVGHPLFPVCLEWPTVLAGRDLLTGAGLERAEAARGVHLRHDQRSVRAVRAGDRLSTVASVAGLTTHRAGGLLDLDLVTTDADDAVVTRTRMTTLYRGVPIVGADRPPPEADDQSDQGHDGATDAGSSPDEPVTVGHHEIEAGLAHTYTECSRIWNPIHTDARTAARAGLPGIILHGTATLAMAVNDVLAALGAEPDDVRRVQVRFGAAVALPSAIDVRVGPVSADGTAAAFEARGIDGEPVLRRGLVVVVPQLRDATRTGASRG